MFFLSNRTSTDAAARKMLTFEYGQFMKRIIALFTNDQTACFHRMIPAFTNAIAQAHGVSKNTLHCQAKMIEAMKWYIKTGLGILKHAYHNPPGKPKIQGKIQGKGDVASLWTMTSSILLFAHALLYTGLILPSAVEKKGVKKNNDAYMRMMLTRGQARWSMEKLSHTV